MDIENLVARAKNAGAGSPLTQGVVEGIKALAARVAELEAENERLSRRAADVCCALDEAHWLSGDAPQRIRTLVAEREAAIEGKHPVQQARGVVLLPQSNR